MLSVLQADSGAMGGSNSAEFMVKSEVGEDDVVFCNHCDYAANIEKATSTLRRCRKRRINGIKKNSNSKCRGIDEVRSF